MHKHNDKTNYKVMFVMALLMTVTACSTVASGGFAVLGRAATDERRLGDIVNDTSIHAEITHYFVQSDVNDLLTNVTVRVYDGRVMLTGRVKNPLTAKEAERLSWIARGVVEVINNIEVSDKKPVVDKAMDEWIETQIETRFLVTKNIRSMNYVTEVENGIVYLLGIAQDEEELRRAVAIASRVKNVKKVVSYLRLKDDPRNRNGNYAKPIKANYDENDADIEKTTTIDATEEEQKPSQKDGATDMI